MVDPVGVGLLVVGLALIVAELTFPGYYIGVAGTVGVIVGLLQMMSPSFLLGPTSALVASLVAVVAAGASFLFYRRFASPLNELGGAPGPELVGKTGTVTQTIRPHTNKGRVQIDGKLWGADGPEPIPPGQRVIVERILTPHLFVRRDETSQSTTLVTEPPNDRRHQ